MQTAEEKRAARLEYKRSPEGRAKRKAYDSTPWGRAQQKACTDRYRAAHPDRVKASKNSPAAKRAAARYRRSPAGKARQRARDLRPERVAAQKAALAKRRRFSPDQIGILLHYQDHTCGICGCTIAASAACDHDHTTGEYRGLLCMPCNVTEGYIRKSGLTPAEYGARLEAYLANPPASIFELV